MLKDKWFAKGFLVFLGAVCLYFSIKCSSQLYEYFTLTGQARPEIYQWEIEDKKGRFALIALYRFSAGGTSFNGKTTLREPYYLNKGAAVQGLREAAGGSFTAWYNPKKPASSSLERSFPLKVLIRTLMSLSILVYFIAIERNRKLFN